MKFDAQKAIWNKETLIHGRISDAEIMACLNTREFGDIVIFKFADKIAECLMARVGPAITQAFISEFGPQAAKPE